MKATATIKKLPSGFFAVFIGSDFINAALPTFDDAIRWAEEQKISVNKVRA